MALPSWLLVFVSGRCLQCPGPSLKPRPLGSFHQCCYKSWVSLWDPPCAHGVSGTPHEEVRNNVHVLFLLDHLSCLPHNKFRWTMSMDYLGLQICLLGTLTFMVALREVTIRILETMWDIKNKINLIRWG
jgi:hypothetical protein